MNILSIDYGTKNIGLAKWSSDAKVVLPFGTVSSILEVADLIKNQNIDKVLIGMPLGLDSQENKNTKRVKQFVEDLKQYIKVPIEFVDERFTSQQADRMGKGVSRDEKAAMIIMQAYLETTNNKTC